MRENDGFIDWKIIPYVTLSAPCYRPRRWWKEKTLKLLHLLSTYHCPEAARPPRFFIGACADDLKALTNLSDIRSKPFSYALFVVVFKGRHAFAALRFVSFGPSQPAKQAWRPIKKRYTTEKSKSPSAAVDLYRFFIGSRGKTARKAKRSKCFKVPASARSKSY